MLHWKVHTKSEEKKGSKSMPVGQKKIFLSEKNSYNLGSSCFEKTVAAFKDYILGNFKGIESQSILQQVL